MKLDSTITDYAPPTLQAPADAADPAAARSLRLQLASALSVAIIIASAVAVTTYDFPLTGPTWPDSPRYANAGAMFHDWMRSGQWLHPVAFAQQNYSQYPAFNVPYHPPGVPMMLGLLFLATGVSYTAARLLITACLAAACVLFFALLRKLGASRWLALAAALVFVTTPEITRWGRDTMSEVPALMFFFAASWFFVAWVESRRPAHIWIAFALAQLAFLCRVTAAGLMPGWFIYLLFAKQYRRLISPHLLIPSVLYVLVSNGYVHFAALYGQYEVAASGPNIMISWDQIAYFGKYAQLTAAWGTTWLFVLGLVVLAVWRKKSPAALFMLAWLLSFTLFKLTLKSTPEIRHFLGALPAMAGLGAFVLAAAPSSPAARRPVWRTAALAALVIGIGVNLVAVAQLPPGVVGHEAAAEALARQHRPGNVLTACWFDQDFMFRYRACRPAEHRQIIRSDRTLTIRVSDYANVPTRVVAQQPTDVLRIIRAGRIRYLLTTSSTVSAYDDRYQDMVIADHAVRTMPDKFKLLATVPLTIRINQRHRRGELYLWEYLEDLPPGPSELDIIIPTANLTLPPPDAQ